MAAEATDVERRGPARRTSRQDEVVAASLALIAEQGMEGLTLRNLARRLGVSEPAIYRHFASKSDIVLRVLDHLEVESLELHRLAVEQGASGEGLRALRTLGRVFIGYAEMFVKDRGLAAVLFPEEIGQGGDEVKQRVLTLMAQTQSRLAAQIEAGQERGEIRGDVAGEHVAVMVMGTLRLAVTRWRLVRYETDLAAEVEGLWRALESMMRRKGHGGCI